MVTNIAETWGVHRTAVVGLMGGSFNPAHEGHLHISRLACERLRLDRLIWIVSPQNPLKSTHQMDSFQNRFHNAQAMANRDGRIFVSDLEARFGTRHTAETLSRLKAEAPDLRMVWVMGADNLAQIDQWESWATIFATVPIAVFARPPYSAEVMTCRAADIFADSQQDESCAADLAMQTPPAWIYFHTPLNPESATRIRAERGV